MSCFFFLSWEGGWGKEEFFFHFSFVATGSNVFLMGFLLSFGGEEAGKEKDFKKISFVTTGSNVFPMSFF